MHGHILEYAFQQKLFLVSQNIQGYRLGILLSQVHRPKILRIPDTFMSIEHSAGHNHPTFALRKHLQKLAES
jgi:hypothetical protein